MSDMLKVRMFDQPSDAPTYRPPEYEAVTLKSVNVVGNGTTDGNPTVDLILIDDRGQKYVALVKGSFIEAVGGAVSGKRKKSKH